MRKLLFRDLLVLRVGNMPDKIINLKALFLSDEHG
jgi:hypothetical protein